MVNRKLYIILLIVVLLLAGCRKERISNIPKEENEGNNLDTLKEIKDGEVKDLNEYIIEVDVDTENMSYIGKQRLSYTNNTGIDIKEIYFHLYPNAFKTLGKAPILFNKGENMDSENYVPGYIDINKVMVNGKDLKWNVEKETILHINLEEPLKNNHDLDIHLEYQVKIPTTKDRFGYHDKGINCGNWYPIVCVYDEKGWNLEPYYKVGDPFYSEVSNYKVSITTPKDFVVVASGKIVSQEEKDDKKTYHIVGKEIRDFAWAASKDFVVKERKTEGTTIKLYSISDNPDIINESLDMGEKSIKIFSKIFGKYPYEEYSIVNTEFPSGMEYPTIIFISNDYFQKKFVHILERIIVHETAHQWWYGIVGNDQVKEAWLDEGLTTYSEVIYMKEAYGEKTANKYYDEGIRQGYEYMVQYLGKDQIVNKPLKEFSGWDDYSLLVYTRGAMFIHKIKEEFGERVLYEILRAYYDRYKFNVATTEDFIKICEEITSTSFEPLVKEYLYGNR